VLTEIVLDTDNTSFRILVIANGSEATALGQLVRRKAA